MSNTAEMHHLNPLLQFKKGKLFHARCLLPGNISKVSINVEMIQVCKIQSAFQGFSSCSFLIACHAIISIIAMLLLA